MAPLFGMSRTTGSVGSALVTRRLWKLLARGPPSTRTRASRQSTRGREEQAHLVYGCCFGSAHARTGVYSSGAIPIVLPSSPPLLADHHARTLRSPLETQFNRYAIRVVYSL